MHTILFTGHMIDKNGRTESRFPPSKEPAVRDKLRACLEKLKPAQTNLLGIAGGACGGDILFHELCLDLSIPSEIHLALPVQQFKKHSVSFAGPDWDQRFDNLVNCLPVHVPPEDEHSPEKNVWAETNLRMLQSAITRSGSDFTLVALWDKKPGDGDGGTEQMVEAARKKKAAVEIIDITSL